MAVGKQGILGGLSGKIGNVTGSSWKGRAVFKSRPLSVANPQTAGQVSNRSAFKSCVQFASLILANLIIPLMNRFAGNVSGYNYFVSRNKAYFDGNGLFDYQYLNFGVGKLGDTPITSAVADNSANTITVNWSTALDNAYKQATDEAYVLFYNESNGVILAQAMTGNDRSTGSVAIGSITDMAVGENIGVYLIFLRGDGTQVGNTAYLHTIVVA